MPHPNVAAGVFEIALPLNAALIIGRGWLIRKQEGGRAAASSAVLLAGAVLTFLTIGGALAMTSSRGAWAALGLVALAAGAIAVGTPVLRRFGLEDRAWIPLGLSVVLGAALALLQFGDPNQVWNWLGSISAGNSVVTRADLFRQTWGLIQDYYFTGAGLGVFPMVLSTYGLLMHVPYLTHAHNLILQVWMEQGLAGLAALGWLVVEFYLWAWRRRAQMNWAAVGGVAAATVMLLHGLVDVLLYSSLGLPLLFVPFALAIAGRRAGSAREREQSASRKPIVTGGLALAGASVAALLIIVGFMWSGPLTAMWYANLGSVEQTRVELARYSFPENLVEYTRRECGNSNGNCELTSAEGYLEHALASDAGNVTANQRLGELRLARGEYEPARLNLERAYARDPGNELTWQLLGDAYLALGRLDEAYALWSKVDGAASKLEIEAAVRFESVHDARRAEWAKNLAERVREDGK